MSGLLVKSTAFMKDNLEAFNEKGITIPIVLGGAALTPKFVYNDCQQVYNGQVIYGKSFCRFELYGRAHARQTGQ